MLVRVLYEHVTIFSWLAIDPANHLPKWVREDREQRLKVDDDMRRFGRPLISAKPRMAFEDEVASILDGWPGVAGMAQQVDAHWSTHMKEFSTDVYGLRGMYGAIYRPFSTLVHGMVESLNRVVVAGPSTGVSRIAIVEEVRTEQNAFTNAPFI